jgi:hypothetical protein
VALKGSFLLFWLIYFFALSTVIGEPARLPARLPACLRACLPARLPARLPTCLVLAIGALHHRTLEHMPT